MDQVSSQQFPQVYEDLGIDTNQLGCIMADTETIGRDRTVRAVGIELGHGNNPPTVFRPEVSSSTRQLAGVRRMSAPAPGGQPGWRSADLRVTA